MPKLRCGDNFMLPRHHQSRFGWRPDKPDARDLEFNSVTKRSMLGLAPRAVLPEVDLRNFSGLMPPVYDQGDLGSCTGNAIAGAYEYEQRREGLTDFTPSRLFIYYNERVIEGTVTSDAGAEIRDGMKSINKLGVPDETLWPYDLNRFAECPPPAAFDAALKHQAMRYARVAVRSVNVKAALSALTPVVVGFTVYESFEDTGSDGIVSTPDPKRESILGGHAVLIVGYKRIHGWRGVLQDHAIVRNSWGSSWGEGGYCYMPMTWLCNTKYADDFWAIQDVEG